MSDKPITRQQCEEMTRKYTGILQQLAKQHKSALELLERQHGGLPGEITPTFCRFCEDGQRCEAAEMIRAWKSK